MGEIIRMMTGLADLVYFSARKLSSSRGGGICTNQKALYSKMEAMIPLFEGFLTYGGISVREIEAMAVGLYETLDETMISQSPSFIKYLVESLDTKGIPAVTPPGVLGAHVDAMKFCDHIPQEEYPAGALAAALYICSGIRGMERGTISSVRDENGKEILADVELLRLAVPRRVFTLSQINYVIDRLEWLYDNRRLIGASRPCCASSWEAWSPRATGPQNLWTSSARISATVSDRHVAYWICERLSPYRESRSYCWQ